MDEHKNHVRESIGVDAKERATEELIAKYKYQIDIGGGGAPPGADSSRNSPCRACCCTTDVHEGFVL